MTPFPSFATYTHISFTVNILTLFLCLHLCLCLLLFLPYPYSWFDFICLSAPPPLSVYLSINLSLSSSLLLFLSIYLTTCVFINLPFYLPSLFFSPPPPSLFLPSHLSTLSPTLPLSYCTEYSPGIKRYKYSTGQTYLPKRDRQVKFILKVKGDPLFNHLRKNRKITWPLYDPHSSMWMTIVEALS